MKQSGVLKYTSQYNSGVKHGESDWNQFFFFLKAEYEAKTVQRPMIAINSNGTKREMDGKTVCKCYVDEHKD